MAQKPRTCARTIRRCARASSAGFRKRFERGDADAFSRQRTCCARMRKSRGDDEQMTAAMGNEFGVAADGSWSCSQALTASTHGAPFRHDQCCLRSGRGAAQAYDVAA